MQVAEIMASGCYGKVRRMPIRADAPERERSMKEEHVDGGYVVTQGIYVGTEDFSKAVVRQLMVGP